MNETVDGATVDGGCGGRRLVVGLLERNRMMEYGGAVMAEDVDDGGWWLLLTAMRSS